MIGTRHLIVRYITGMVAIITSRINSILQSKSPKTSADIPREQGQMHLEQKSSCKCTNSITHVKGTFGLARLAALLCFRMSCSLGSPRLLDLGSPCLSPFLLLLLSKFATAVEIFPLDVLLRVGGKIATAKTNGIGGGRRGNKSGEGDEAKGCLVGKEHGYIIWFVIPVDN